MLVRNTLVLGPAVILPRLSAFLVVLILTHTLSTSEFGLYALVQLVGETLDMTCSAWIRFSLLRLDISNPGGWRAGFQKSYILSAIATALGCGAAAFVSWILAPDRSGAFLIGVAAYIASNALLRMGLTSLQMRQKNLQFSILESVRAVAQILAVFATLFVLQRTFLTFSLSMSAVACAVGICAIYLSRNGVPLDSQPAASYMTRLKYGSSLIALTLLAYIVSGSDRFFLKLIDGPSLVGLYSAAYVLGRQPIDMVANAINQGGFPELMKRFDMGGVSAAELFISDTFQLYGLLVFSTLAVLWCLAPTMAAALLPPAYRSTAVIVIPLIGLAGTVQTMKAFVFDNIFHMYRRNWLQLMSYFPAALVTTVAALLLIRPYGAIGAAVAAFLGMTAGLVGSALMTRRLLRLKIEMREFIKSPLIAGITSLGGVSAMLTRDAGMGALFSLVVGILSCGFIWLSLVILLQPIALAGARGAVFLQLRGFAQRLGVNSP